MVNLYKSTGKLKTSYYGTGVYELDICGKFFNIHNEGVYGWILTHGKYEEEGEQIDSFETKTAAEFMAVQL